MKRFRLAKPGRRFGPTALSVAIAIAVLSASAETIPYLLESDAPSTAPDTFIWATEPGVRYNLWESDDLEDWRPVDGFPIEATGLSLEHSFAPDARKFFRIEPLDEQPPVIMVRDPDDGGFGVPRFGDIEIQLDDATGIDPASITLSVGSLGAFTLVDTELSYADGLITFDHGPDVALGGYGEDLVISLAIADTLGNGTTYEWSCALEKDIQLVENLFVFGSPDALRAGQEVGAIPTRVLIQGPIRMDGPGDTWSLRSVTEATVVLAYTGATAPVFAVDTYICNRTPATLDEIFYRKITSISDDTTNKLLTLHTVDVGLAEIITEGSFSTAGNGIAFEVDGDGVIQRAIDFDKKLLRG